MVKGSKGHSAAEAHTELEKWQGRRELKPQERRGIAAQAMPEQDASQRVQNMCEVALGYGREQAQLEALRCLQCKNAPCIAGCPVAVDIPRFIAATAAGDFAEALRVVKTDNLLPAVCGRVCPQESQCQAQCVVGKFNKDPRQAVAIGRLERYVADWGRTEGAEMVPAVGPDTGHKVAVIGSGPASVTVAADVRRAGHAVTVFEAFHKPGGVLLYGIPEFRLPKNIVAEEIETLRAMGVEIKTNFVVGRTRTIPQLLTEDTFAAIFIGSGAGLPRFMRIPGEELIGVYSANEYLTRVNLMRAYEFGRARTPILRAQRVAVLGGGNVAMDAARSALRLGAAEVHLIYRRTEAEMPARLEEIEHAKEEGVNFHYLQNARRIVGDEQGRVSALELQRYELGEADESGRRAPVLIPDSDFTMEMDGVIIAIGNDSNPLIVQTTPGLAVDRRGRIKVDAEQRTSLDRVFAGGDIVLGAATVILAMGEGRRAARSINQMLAAREKRREA